METQLEYLSHRRVRTLDESEVTSQAKGINRTFITAPSRSTNDAPTFDSVKTNKVHYRDDVREWSFTIRTLALTDDKYKGILIIICVMIYIN